VHRRFDIISVDWEAAVAEGTGLLTNYHTHCYLDDGNGKPEEYVEQARSEGLRALGFSCHAPLPFPTDWVLTKEKLGTYMHEIAAMKKRFGDSIEIYMGLEVDYVRDIAGPLAPAIAALRLDYTVGSVHFVGAEQEGEHGTIDRPEAEFRELLESAYGGDARRLVREYYLLMREMVEQQTPDIVGHMDVIKKNNPKGKYFDEGAAWYRDEIMKTLETVAASGAIVEVNTGGLARKRTDAVYPSPWILRECNRLGIPTHINSDAHVPEQVAYGFGDARAVLRECGYRERLVLLAGKWEMVDV
jgi:histidinol-phosphatase (PHP family)